MALTKLLRPDDDENAGMFEKMTTGGAQFNIGTGDASVPFFTLSLSFSLIFVARSHTRARRALSLPALCPPHTNGFTHSHERERERERLR